MIVRSYDHCFRTLLLLQLKLRSRIKILKHPLCGYCMVQVTGKKIPVQRIYVPFEYSVCRAREAYALCLHTFIFKNKAYASSVRHTEYSNGT